jgi:hypothetical protein
MEDLKKYVKATKAYPGFKKIDFKWSDGTGNDFPKLKIKIRLSGTRTTLPTAPRIDSAHCRTSSDVDSVAQMPAIPSPISAGVFGIARTTEVCEPDAFCKADALTPAAMDSTRVAPALLSAAHVSTAPPGFTAITAAEHGPMASLVLIPGNRFCNALRRSADSSTTEISVVFQPARNKPSMIAPPMLPPPTNVIGSFCMWSG